MANKNTSIKINGRQYDALSGRSIDGVLKTGHPAVAAHHTPATRSTPTHAPASKPVMDIRRTRQPAAKASAHHAKPSVTLMRHAVHKPATSLKSHAKVQASTLSLLNEPAAVVVPKLSLYSVDPKREARAAKIAHSKKISHFISLPTGANHQPQPVFNESLAPAKEAPLAKPAAKPDIFERALAAATSHKEEPLSRKQLKHAKKANRTPKRKALNVSASALAVLLIAGFVAYQNMANMTLKVAASKAGFAATLPGYKPAGFAVGKFSYSPGNVAINFHSNSDSRHFAVLEKPSNWDSATLLNDYVASAGGSSYQTVSTGGRTIYVYDHNATWVNNGVWYVVHGDNALSDRQLTELASSM